MYFMIFVTIAIVIVVHVITSVFLNVIVYDVGPVITSEWRCYRV